MVKHTKICTKNENGTWKYKCTCGKVVKDGLKFESSATAIHEAHIKNENRYAQSHK